VRQLSIADITLSWVEADMAGIGPTLCRAVAAEHVRDLQRWTRHASRALGGRFGAHFELARDAVERAHDFPDGLGGDTGIERRGVELGVPQYWVALALLAGTLAFVYSSSGLAAGWRSARSVTMKPRQQASASTLMGSSSPSRPPP
jgi:hypothetical protein